MTFVHTVSKSNTILLNHQIIHHFSAVAPALLLYVGAETIVDRWRGY